MLQMISLMAVMAVNSTPIEVVQYKNSAEVHAAWIPMGNTEPASLSTEKSPSGEPALLLPCDLTKETERASWDKTVSLDLSAVGRISFWLKVTGDRDAISGCSIFFASGSGWYTGGYSLPEDGWQKVALDKSAFRTEGTPAGWKSIGTIRISFWKGLPGKATVLIAAVEAHTADVAIVRNTRAGAESGQWTERMSAILARAGVEAGMVDDTDVETGILAGKHIAIYPFNPNPSDSEMDALEAFVKAGGRVMACFSLPPRMASLLGVKDEGYAKEEYPGEYSRMQMTAAAPKGAPKYADQSSWNIEKVSPNGRNARVVAKWLDKNGKETGLPAIIMSDTGAFVTHVVLDDDAENKDRLLLATLGEMWPGVWEKAAKDSTAFTGRFGAWNGFADAMGTMRKTPGIGESVKTDLNLATDLRSKAENELKSGKWREAIDDATTSRKHLLAAYEASRKPKPGEFRAVWCHSAYGVAGMTWDESMRRLKENGFTAVVPNMLWAGLADYQSDLIPVNDRVAKDGDQIALCLNAARKYGMQVHVWKVNWNLGNAPKAFVDRMRTEGRLQRDNTGKEVEWLCPSNPENFKLERDTMLEVARKYPVDGIHFDYIRYPDDTACYCDQCRARFEEAAGLKVANWPRDVLSGGPQYKAYQDFRRGNITRLVKAVSEEAHKIRPGIKVSAAVFGSWPGCRDSVGQDWGFWVKQGWLDFVCPMDYTDSNGGYRAMVRIQNNEVNGKIPLIAGVGASAPGLPVDQIIAQIEIARETGANGFIIFNYDPFVAKEVLPALGKGLTK